MVRPRTVTPARLRRAFFIFAATSLGVSALPAAEISASQPSAAEAGRMIQQVREAGIPGEYYLEFELHELPRRGEETIFEGRLWGSHNARGNIERVELTDRDGKRHRLLVQNGERASVWRLADGRAEQLGVTQLFAPVIPGVELTAFDLQMPFLYWPDVTLEGLARVRGREAYAFVFRAPPAFAAAHTEIAAVRAYLDAAVNALVETQQLDKNGRVLKTFSLASLKTVNRQPLPKSLEFRDETTRNKTRLTVTAAALQLSFGPGLFTPAALTEDVRPPTGELVRLEP